MEGSSNQVSDSPEDLYIAVEEAMYLGDGNSLVHALTMARALRAKTGLSFYYIAKADWLIATCILLLKHDTEDGKQSAEECLEICDQMKHSSGAYNLDDVEKLERAALSTLAGLQATIDEWDATHLTENGHGDGEKDIIESIENVPEEYRLAEDHHDTQEEDKYAN